MISIHSNDKDIYACRDWSLTNFVKMLYIVHNSCEGRLEVSSEGNDV
jgi:hypothetical protein